MLRSSLWEAYKRSWQGLPRDNHPESVHKEYQETGAGDYSYIYQFIDHLGNKRLSYSDLNDDGIVETSEIRSEKNYYPFGLTQRGYNGQMQGTYYPYGFGGKEEQSELELEWLDFSARNYDASLGRWMNLDPLAEDMRRHSPYNYGFNNPISFIDPDGMKPFWINNGDGTYTAEKGDSAATLAKDAGISEERANELVQQQHGKNYKGKDGGVKSNLDPKDVVAIPEQQQEIADVGATLENEGKEPASSESTDNTSESASLLDKAGEVASDLVKDALGMTEVEEGISRALEAYDNEGINGYLYTSIANAHMEEAGGSGGRSKKRSRSNGVRSTKNKSKRVRSTKTKASTGTTKSTPKNSWNAFLQQNKGKYKGKGWIKRAAADYRAQQ